MRHRGRGRDDCVCLYLQDTHKTLGSLALMELFTHTHTYVKLKRGRWGGGVTKQRIISKKSVDCVRLSPSPSVWYRGDCNQSLPGRKANQSDSNQLHNPQPLPLLPRSCWVRATNFAPVSFFVHVCLATLPWRDQSGDWAGTKTSCLTSKSHLLRHNRQAEEQDAAEEEEQRQQEHN